MDRAAGQWGRRLRATQRSAVLGVTFGQIATADARRVALIVSSSSAGRLVLSNRADTAGSDAGIMVPAAAPVHVFTVDQCGDWVAGDIFARGQVALTMHWVEVIDPEP